MKDLLYDEAQGISFLAVHIFKLVQEDTIMSEKELFLQKTCAVSPLKNWD